MNLADIEKRYPDLSVEGFDTPDRAPPHRLSRDSGGFDVAMEFIKAGAPGRRRRRRESYFSYQLKHDAERWTQERGPRREYVSNGATIAAAIASGWSVQRARISAYLKPPISP